MPRRMLARSSSAVSSITEVAARSLSARMASSSSKPSISGMLTSEITTSGRVCCARSRPSLPLTAETMP